MMKYVGYINIHALGGVRARDPSARLVQDCVCLK